MLGKAGNFARKHWAMLSVLALLVLFTAAKAPTFGIVYVNRDEPLYAWQSLAIYHSPEMLFSQEISYVYAFALVPAMASPLNAFFDATVSVRIVSFLFSLAGLFLTYLVGKKMFLEKTGIAAMAFLMLSPIFFYSANKAMPDVPTAALGVLLIYLLLTLNKRRAALIPFIVLAMYLIRTSSLVVLPPTAIYLLAKYRKKISKKQAIIALAATAMASAAGYLLSGYTSFSMLSLMQKGTNYALFFQLKFQNLFWVAFGIPISFFAILGMIKLRKEKGPDIALLFLWIFLTAIPFLLLKLMWDRYYLFAIPAMAIIAGYGFFWLAGKNKQALAAATAAIAILIIFSGSFAYNPYLMEYKKPYSSQTLAELEAFLEKNLEKENRLIIMCDEYVMRAYRASAEKSLQNAREQILVNPSRQEFEAITADGSRSHYILACRTSSGELAGASFESLDFDSYLGELGFEKQQLFPEEETIGKRRPELYKKPEQ